MIETTRNIRDLKRQNLKQNNLKQNDIKQNNLKQNNIKPNNIKQNNIKQNDLKRQIIKYIAVILIAGGMIFLSEFFNEKEIIFPEIAAISVGAILAPTFSWKTSKKLIFLLIFLCAALGLGISFFVTGSIITKMLLAYAVGQIILLVTKTSFAPLISAITLPVLLETDSIVYLLSAVGLTGAILLVRIFLEKIKVVSETTFIPMDRLNVDEFLGLFLREVILMLCLILALRWNFKFSIAPPLIVAFTELTNKSAKPMQSIQSKIKTIILVIISALSGAGFRFWLSMNLGLPLTVSAVVAMLVTVFTIDKFKIYLPPAGAITILAFLIPQKMVKLYPVHVTCGIIAFVIAASWVIWAKDAIYMIKNNDKLTVN